MKATKQLHEVESSGRDEHAPSLTHALTHTLDHSWLDEAHANRLFSQLQRACTWHREEIVMCGRRISVPRLTAWYGDSGLSYRYSGLDHRAEGWPSNLAEIRTRLSEQFEQPFNFVLLNRYRDGQDYMGWHSDDEAGVRGGIASLSLGCARRFTTRLKPSALAPTSPAKPGPIQSMTLANGSLLFMPPGFQDKYLHALPKAPRLKPRSDASPQASFEDTRFASERINLTFRWLSGQR